LTACPVQAFSAAGYDVDACARWLRKPEGADCLGGGCLARRACPVGADYAQAPEQARFHMAAFFAAR
jgi:epoxyqueuosine reductase